MSSYLSYDNTGMSYDPTSIVTTALSILRSAAPTRPCTCRLHYTWPMVYPLPPSHLSSFISSARVIYLRALSLYSNGRFISAEWFRQEAIGFSGDLKLGHYVKIPPYTMFKIQVVAAVVNCLVLTSIQDWMFANIVDLIKRMDSTACPIICSLLRP
jgi:hypothetical protein